MTIKVSAIQCPECKDWIYSRANHDMRWCSCGSIAIDGGFEYTRIVGACGKSRVIKLVTTREKLYEDWKTRKDRYGLIKDKKK